MGSTFLNSAEARKLVEDYVKNEGPVVSTQEILDSGEIPRLKEYVVRPGKVSDSIFGGKGSYFDKKTGRVVEFENPPLNVADGSPLRIMVRTDRISTHDINRGYIPFKDQVLAANHDYMRRMLATAIGTSQFEVAGLGNNSVVIAAENLKQIPFENVLRAFMAKSSTSTSLYQHYMKGEREFCGHILPNNLFTNGPLPYVMDTPSTKSEDHDESVSPDELFRRKVCSLQEYIQIRNASLFAFGMVSQFLKDRGLIAVDTKTEHGINRRGEIVAQDEIWTMDSSRFWLLDDYNEQMKRFSAGEIKEINPVSYSKEFARGFSEGDKGYTEDQRIKIAVRYIEGIQHLLRQRFEPDTRPRHQRVVFGIEAIIEQLVA
ncbi:phosphoribosylaminoimidazolesuccinocarboxamide synthase [Candidatus Woesearchaeota archaeon]|nr:phosphoribosylaminoimidazolesuccinocarboxamide synthase [Candidatus Woesearchaeota archaeon]